MADPLRTSAMKAAALIQRSYANQHRVTRGLLCHGSQSRDESLAVRGA